MNDLEIIMLMLNNVENMVARAINLEYAILVVLGLIVGVMALKREK